MLTLTLLATQYGDVMLTLTLLASRCLIWRCEAMLLLTAEETRWLGGSWSLPAERWARQVGERWW